MLYVPEQTVAKLLYIIIDILVEDIVALIQVQLFIAAPIAIVAVQSVLIIMHILLRDFRSIRASSSSSPISGV